MDHIMAVILIPTQVEVEAVNIQVVILMEAVPLVPSLLPLEDTSCEVDAKEELPLKDA